MSKTQSLVISSELVHGPWKLSYMARDSSGKVDIRVVGVHGPRNITSTHTPYVASDSTREVLVDAAKHFPAKVAEAIVDALLLHSTNITRGMKIASQSAQQAYDSQRNMQSGVISMTRSRTVQVVNTGGHGGRAFGEAVHLPEGTPVWIVGVYESEQKILGVVSNPGHQDAPEVGTAFFMPSVTSDDDLPLLPDEELQGKFCSVMMTAYTR